MEHLVNLNLWIRTWANDHWLWRPFGRSHFSHRPCDCQHRSAPPRTRQRLWELPEWFSVWRPIDPLQWWYPVPRAAHRNCSIWWWDLCNAQNKENWKKKNGKIKSNSTKMQWLTWVPESLAIDCLPTDCSNRVESNAFADGWSASRATLPNPSFSLRLYKRNKHQNLIIHCRPETELEIIIYLFFSKIKSSLWLFDFRIIFNRSYTIKINEIPYPYSTTTTTPMATAGTAETKQRKQKRIRRCNEIVSSISRLVASDSHSLRVYAFLTLRPLHSFFSVSCAAHLRTY